MLLEIRPELKGFEGHHIMESLKTKSQWQPSFIDFHDTIEETQLQDDLIRRCIALGMVLEIPVGEFALEGIGKIHTDSLKGLGELALSSNAYDEDVHYQAFQYAKDSYEVPQELIDEADRVCLDFILENAHPIYKAGFVELSVFFVTLTMLRKFGDSNIKLLSRDITRDEAVHVKTNWWLIDELKISLSTPKLKKLNTMRKDIIEWLAGDDPVLGVSKDYWIEQSDSLINTRKAKGFQWTAAPVMPAFLEMPRYSAKY